MGKVGERAHKILVWSYERGTVQYDIICVLILAFIFLVPPSCFLKKRSSQNEPHASAREKLTSSSSDTAPANHPRP